MKLQHKAWALILAVVGLCAGSAMYGARYIVTEAFDTLLAERVNREGNKALRVLDQQVQALSATARDYAFWGDAVDFVAGGNPGFMAENFDVENLASLRISDVLVLDAQGGVVATLTPQGKVLTEVAPQRVAALREAASPILTTTNPKTVFQTLRVADGKLDLVVAAAIHGPEVSDTAVKGAMVLVRTMNDTEVARLADVLLTTVRLSFDSPGSVGQPLWVKPVDEQRDDLYATLRDHEGRPVADLVLGLDRSLQKQGRLLTFQGMGLAAAAGLVASVMLVFLLDRLLLQRLQRLHGDLKEVTERGPSVAGHLTVRGRDELAHLAEGINQLLSRVKADADAQREAHERQEALQVQLMQSQKTEALGRLTGGIAHDFNNSLAAITGWVRLANEDLTEEHPSREALQQALKATRYADGLMRQLLAFGRQSAPKLRRLHWGSLIEETRQMVASGLTRGCEVVASYRIDNDEVDADPTQLQQVLVNLLINAADAMKGQGRIELVLDRLDLSDAPVDPARHPGTAELEPGRYLLLSVRDHGPGIPTEHLDRIFDPFFTTKAKGRGTGLGLSVAQGIMARHQGAIGLTSGPDGACFYLYLPDSRQDSSISPITSPGDPGQGRQLLFVDDDQSVRHAWSALLERKGWHVTRAADGEEAWLQLSHSGKHWDVVLTDQSMPRLDGVGLAQRIRASLSPVPVVLMSGHVDEVSPELLRSLFVAVLHKPVDADELDQVLQGVLPLSDAHASRT